MIASMSIASKVSEGRLMLSGLERPDSPPSDGSEARGAPSSPSNSWTSAEARELELRPFARFAHNSADEPRRRGAPRGKQGPWKGRGNGPEAARSPSRGRR